MLHRYSFHTRPQDFDTALMNGKPRPVADLGTRGERDEREWQESMDDWTHFVDGHSIVSGMFDPRVYGGYAGLAIGVEHVGGRLYHVPVEWQVAVDPKNPTAAEKAQLYASTYGRSGYSTKRSLAEAVAAAVEAGCVDTRFAYEKGSVAVDAAIAAARFMYEMNAERAFVRKAVAQALEGVERPGMWMTREEHDAMMLTPDMKKARSVHAQLMAEARARWAEEESKEE